jgi:hypothetical protein
MALEALLKEKSKRLEQIPLNLQTVVIRQQKQVLDEIMVLLNDLDVKNGQIVISKENLKTIQVISDEMRKVFLNDEYLKGVKEFAKEFDKQAVLNDKIIKETIGEVDTPIASQAYLDTAKRSAVTALVETKEFIQPIQSLLENTVVNGASLRETIDSIRTFTNGNTLVDSKVLVYVKQITNDAFAIADRSYSSILSDFLDNDWYYYAGGEIATTRCFCDKRVGNYYHYLEIESWGAGKNLGECNIGSGKWAGQMAGTNEATIYSYLGGYNCMHSLIPVSEFVVSDSDKERAKKLGFIKD